jgi:Tol biopolymer transport system component/LysM repeat protein
MTARTIGRYLIREELGRGGMATVFRAHDPRFGRDIAVKVLPSAFMHDPAFRTRFEREARTIAALEHPAIVPVYDFGEHEGQPYLVMRLMTGGSLADRLAEGSLSLAETGEILRRISSALEKAHTKGIIHRDLKPGNILFDQDNNAYLSDFGIAKLSESTVAMTGNHIIGTPAYMSPEQARGDEHIDGRSDIYALGIIYYQMLTGHLPYQADTPMAVVVKHITDPVPTFQADRPDLPPTFNAILGRAMAKEAGQRYGRPTEMAADLTNAISGRPLAAATEAAATRQSWQAVTEIDQPPDPYGQPAYQPSTPAYGQQAPAYYPPTPGYGQPQPDYGQPVAQKRGLPGWVWIVSGLMGLGMAVGLCIGVFALYSLGQNDTTTPAGNSPVAVNSDPATSTATSSAPVVTEPPPPIDPPITAGQYVVRAGDNLFRIAVAVGISVEELMAANGLSDADTLEVGQVLIIPTPAGPAVTPPTPTAPPSPTTPASPTPTSGPPGGRIVFDSTRDGGAAEIYIMDADGRNQVRLTNNGDQDDEADLSPDGQWIAYESRGSDNTWMIMLMRVDGSDRRALVPGRQPDWSPDGRTIAYETADSQQIWIVEVESGQSRRITEGNRASRTPSWSPDGQQLVVMSEIGNTWQLVILDVNGGRQQVITSGSEDHRFPVWSPDGRWIAYNTVDNGNPDHIWVVDTNGQNRRQITDSGQNGRPGWSPDSRYLVFNANRSGRWLIYRVALDGSDLQQLTNQGADSRPDWGS